MLAVAEVSTVQEQVDRYLELHAEMSALKKEMDTLKKDIRSHMVSNHIQSIKGTEGKQVYLQNAKASNSTSRYTDYELSDVMPLLGDDLKKVTEIRVNAEKLEGLTSLLPPEVAHEIKSKKIVKNGTPRFAVKK